MVVNRVEGASRLDGHLSHSMLAPRHAFDLLQTYFAKDEDYRLPLLLFR